jgi:hypothetical protein
MIRFFIGFMYNSLHLKIGLLQNFRLPFLQFYESSEVDEKSIVDISSEKLVVKSSVLVAKYWSQAGRVRPRGSAK